MAFTPAGWADYLTWQTDRTVLTRLNRMIKEIARDPYSGIGKPKALVGDLSGLWSRRLTHRDRLIYQVDDTQVLVIACREHY